MICSGARRGKQFTYALLDQRVPTRGACGARRSPGRTDASLLLEPRPSDTAGLCLVVGADRARCPRRHRDGGIRIRARRDGRPNAIGSRHRKALAGARRQWSIFCPNYDEYGIAYKDRDVVPYVPRPRHIESADEFAHLLVIDGQLVGRWRRTLKTRQGGRRGAAVPASHQAGERCARCGGRAVQPVHEHAGDGFPGLAPPYVWPRADLCVLRVFCVEVVGSC